MSPNTIKWYTEVHCQNLSWQRVSVYPCLCQFVNCVTWHFIKPPRESPVSLLQLETRTVVSQLLFPECQLYERRWQRLELLRAILISLSYWVSMTNPGRRQQHEWIQLFVYVPSLGIAVESVSFLIRLFGYFRVHISSHRETVLTMILLTSCRQCKDSAVQHTKCYGNEISYTLIFWGRWIRKWHRNFQLSSSFRVTVMTWNFTFFT